jgi:hypothetical protein
MTIQIQYNFIEPAGDAPWAQQSKEKDLWYGRFIIFLMQGTSRNINATYRAEQAQKQKVGNKGNKGKETAPDGWYAQARLFNWVERARAHDQAQFAARREAEQFERQEEHGVRLAQLRKLRDKAFDALENAAIDLLGSDTVVENLPAIRQLYVDVLKLQRLEYGDTTEAVSESDRSSAAITADDFAAAQAEIAKWMAEKK